MALLDKRMSYWLSFDWSLPAQLRVLRCWIDYLNIVNNWLYPHVISLVLGWKVT